MSMVQAVSYGFTIVENPMSDGGNFSTCNSYSAMGVATSGQGEAGTASTNCLMYWSGAVPSGDTGGTWPADQYSQMTIGAMAAPGTDYGYLVVRQSASAHTLYLWVIEANTASPSNYSNYVYGFKNGTATQLLGPVGITINAGDVLQFQVVGDVLTCYQNGSSKMTYTDSSGYGPSATGGAPGLGFYASTVSACYATAWSAGGNQAAAPTFSPNGGTFSSAQTVTLTSSTGGTIYYTTNGSTPTRSSSSVASGGTISISTSCTLQAIASQTNYFDSGVSSAVFTFVAASPAGYCIMVMG